MVLTLNERPSVYSDGQLILLDRRTFQTLTKSKFIGELMSVEREMVKRSSAGKVREICRALMKEVRRRERKRCREKFKASKVSIAQTMNEVKKGRKEKKKERKQRTTGKRDLRK